MDVIVEQRIDRRRVSRDVARREQHAGARDQPRRLWKVERHQGHLAAMYSIAFTGDTGTLPRYLLRGGRV